ncbi:PssE/Cps14G family polysaccharide biosynthesis glycosyltransferase [Terribacillus sp. 7520-G]|uniref:PssE/Cps14G family polysaccharide biosynthesis glycosyltransferase n=1 Tax=Terribacillus sp. 7520-G TaxID=2025389 RepID=UPI000BA71684|nr:PssE/Cps14G family polysaccharide biosynthesis glycosyltransferase [Terribacillus sp. 7520-G]PAD40440.1 exopolysaccharide biosynthesis protein [Terribacillus sp. 7520-G]
MILVVLGTHELPFMRLLREVERLKREGIITDEVIVQAGHTKFESDLLTIKPFVNYEVMDQLMEDARLVITHAGTGSVISALKKGKKVIAAARLKKYGEHNDDHQLQLLSIFLEQRHILSWGEGEDLGEVIRQTESFEPVPFQSGKERMFSILSNFIKEA